MTVGSGRYWFFGMALIALGVCSGCLSPSGPPSTRDSAAYAVSAAPGASSDEPTPDSDSSDVGTVPPDGGAEQVDGDAEQVDGGAKQVDGGADKAKTEPPDPCSMGQMALDEYAALYGGGTQLDKSGKASHPLWSRADYLLALVPDPDPELSESKAPFSAVLEGVEEAVQLGRADQGFAGRLVRDREWLPWTVEATAKCADRAPGVLIFRPPQAQSRPPLVVLLVGETPTWGVRERQLRAALSLVPETNELPLKVLGPTFSGTAASLLALFGRAPGKFQLVSGTATSPSLKSQFKGRLSFAATVPNDNQLLGAMLGYLSVRGGQNDRVAILSEAGTTYGNSTRAFRAPKAGQTPKGGPARKDIAQLPIELRFPVDLNPLRKAVAAAPAPSAAADKGAPPPPLDPQVIVLDEVARTLSQHSVRFVGVIATDPEDVILLTRRLRSKIPDARFFTIGGDIQFSDPALVGELNGMLVAHSAMPPHFDDDLYAGKFERSISLKSELVRNVYLAGRRLLGFPRGEPKARVSLIGNGALWEIGDPAPQFSPPNSWRTAKYLTCLLFGAMLLVVIWPWLVPRLPNQFVLARHRGPPLLSLSSCERADLRADDALVNAALLSVAAGAALLLLIAEYTHRHRAVCVVGAPLVLLACWGRALLLMARGKLGRARPSAFVCSLLALGATGLALGIGCGVPHEATLNLLSGGSPVLAGLIGFNMLGIGLWCWRARLRFLDNHRFSGSQRADQAPLAEAFGEAQGGGTGLLEAERQLLRTIHAPWSALPVVPIAVHALLVLSVLLVYSVRAPAGFEPGWRNALVIGFGLLSLLPITVNFSRIVATWLALERLLQYLALFPILEPLRKLPKKFARNLEQQLTVPNADLTEFGPLIEHLLRLSAQKPALFARAQRAEAAWRTALREQVGPAEPLAALPLGEIMDLLLAAAAELPHDDPDANTYRALLVALFVPRYVRHFRLYVVPVLIGSTLGVFMTSLYFVQPQRLLSLVIFFWVASMVLGAFLVYSALDRSAVISAIGDTTEGSVDLDWTVVSRAITWGVVPLLSLFAAQNANFPNWISVFINAIATSLR